MNPDKQNSRKLRLGKIFKDSSIVVCPGLNEDAPIRTGVVSNDYLDQLFVDDNDDQVGYKSFLGRTISRTQGNDSIGSRVARAMGVVVDELGKLRCPPGTPNANQFTDLQMTGCMDVSPSSRQLINGVGEVADFAMAGVAKKREDTIASRVARVVEKYGPLDTVDQQSVALKKAFPNAKVELKDRFLNRITPNGRRKIQVARKAFVTGLLAEADEFPDVASGFSRISDRLGLINGRGAHGFTLLEESGIGIAMSQWGVTSIGERLSRRLEKRTIKKTNPSLSTIMSNGISSETPRDQYWHHVAVHEFGHAVDVHQIFLDMGFEPGEENGIRDYIKVRPSKDPLIDEAIDSLVKEIAEDSDEVAAKKLSKALSDLFDKIFFDRQLDDEEIAMLDGLLGSAYASGVHQKSPGIHEYIAELFAQVRLAGYGSEINTSNGDIQIRNPREILRQTLGREIPGSDDLAGGRQIGNLTDQKSLKKGLARRLRRGAQRFIPLNMRIDGDNDGKVRNPITGADDVPLANAQRTILSTRARSIVNQRTNQPSLTGQRNRKPMDKLNLMSSFEDDDPDEILKRLGITPGKPARGFDRWGAFGPSSSSVPPAPKIEEREVRRATLKDFKIGKLMRLSDELYELNKELMKKRGPISGSDEDDSSDSVSERAFKRINKLDLRLRQLLIQDRIRQVGADVEIDLTEDEMKRFSKGIESLMEISEELSDDYETIKSDFLDELRKKLGSYRNFSRLDTIEKKSLDIGGSPIELKAQFGRRARRAIRKIIKKPDFDGDGDGFITNPRTGRDDLPITAVSKAPKAVAPKKRTLFDSFLSRSQKGNAPLSYLSPKWSNASSDPNNDSSWAGRLKAMMSQYLDNDLVKDRPWAPIAIRFAEIESILEQRFGKLETPKQIKDAFKTALPTVDVRFQISDSALEDLPTRGEMLGYLYMITQMPDHWSSARKLIIEPLPDSAPKGSSGSYAIPKIKRKLLDDKFRPFASTRLDIHLMPGQILLGDDGLHEKAMLNDTIPGQLVKAYLSHIKDTNAIEDGIISEEDVYKTAALLHSISTAVHESGHVAHYLRASMFTGTETEKEVQELIADTMTDQEDVLKKSSVRSYFSRELSQGLSLLQLVVHAFSYEDDDGNMMPGDIGKVQEAYFAATDPDEEEMLGKLLETWVNSPFLQTGLLPMYIFNGPDTEERANLLSIMQSGYSDSALGQLMWGKDGKSDFSERLWDDLFGYGKSLGIGYGPDGDSADEVREAIATDGLTQVSEAVNYLLESRMWDDLSEGEIAVLRANWKYLSKYAKDKNSFYLDRSGIARPSVEGVAEAMTARIFGLSFIKQNPEAEAALNKLFKWLFTAPDAAITVAFDQIIESLGDIDDSGDDEIKSLYRGLDGASKDLYSFLGLKEPW